MKVGDGDADATPTAWAIVKAQIAAMTSPAGREHRPTVRRIRMTPPHARWGGGRDRGGYPATSTPSVLDVTSSADRTTASPPAAGRRFAMPPMRIRTAAAARRALPPGRAT